MTIDLDFYPAIAEMREENQSFTKAYLQEKYRKRERNREEKLKDPERRRKSLSADGYSISSQSLQGDLGDRTSDSQMGITPIDLVSSPSGHRWTPAPLPLPISPQQHPPFPPPPHPSQHSSIYSAYPNYSPLVPPVQPYPYPHPPPFVNFPPSGPHDPQQHYNYHHGYVHNMVPPPANPPTYHHYPGPLSAETGYTPGVADASTYPSQCLQGQPLPLPSVQSQPQPPQQQLLLLQQQQYHHPSQPPSSVLPTSPLSAPPISPHPLQSQQPLPYSTMNTPGPQQSSSSSGNSSSNLQIENNPNVSTSIQMYSTHHEALTDPMTSPQFSHDSNRGPTSKSGSFVPSSYDQRSGDGSTSIGSRSNNNSVEGLDTATPTYSSVSNLEKDNDPGNNSNANNNSNSSGNNHSANYISGADPSSSSSVSDYSGGTPTGGRRASDSYLTGSTSRLTRDFHRSQSLPYPQYHGHTDIPPFPPTQPSPQNYGYMSHPYYYQPSPPPPPPHSLPPPPSQQPFPSLSHVQPSPFPPSYPPSQIPLSSDGTNQNQFNSSIQPTSGLPPLDPLLKSAWLHPNSASLSSSSFSIPSASPYYSTPQSQPIQLNPQSSSSSSSSSAATVASSSSSSSTLSSSSVYQHYPYLTLSPHQPHVYSHSHSLHSYPQSSSYLDYANPSSVIHPPISNPVSGPVTPTPTVITPMMMTTATGSTSISTATAVTPEDSHRASSSASFSSSSSSHTSSSANVGQSYYQHQYHRTVTSDHPYPHQPQHQDHVSGNESNESSNVDAIIDKTS